MARPFVGDRLREARLARGMTATLVAERVGVTPGAMSQYERRDMQPGPDVMERLAATLGVSPGYFFKVKEVVPQSPAQYRSMSAATLRARDGVEVQLRRISEFFALLERFVDLPGTDVPDLGGSGVLAASEEHVDAAARTVRDAWGLGRGPIPNVVRLIESKGVRVARFAFGAETLDGVSCWLDRRPFVLLNSEYGTAARSRFDAAHELGHLVLHRSVPEGDVRRPDLHKILEGQAHRFAAAFLFPAESFEREVYSVSLDALVSVKRRWNVSVQMMVRRARDLKLVTQDQYERAFRTLSARGWRREEPLDATTEPEQPSLGWTGLDVAIQAKVLTRADVVTELQLSAREIELLAGLPVGSLDDTPPPGVGTVTAKVGKVLEFQRRR